MAKFGKMMGGSMKPKAPAKVKGVGFAAKGGGSSGVSGMAGMPFSKKTAAPKGPMPKQK